MELYIIGRNIMKDCILKVNGMHISCVLLRQVGDDAIIFCQDKILKVKVTFKSILNVTYVELADDNILLDLTLII